MLSLVSGSHELLSSCYVAYRYVSNKPPEALLIKNATSFVSVFDHVSRFHLSRALPCVI